MSRNAKWWLAGGVGLSIGTVGAALWRWKHRRLADLAAGSDLVETDQGTIEVARRGSGFPVLVLHGDPGGYDQGLLLGDAMFGDDIEIIAPSRPGYLRTPLANNKSPSAQAGLLVSLLDELGIEQTMVVGFSGGGPVALQLAAEYPDRISGLLLVSAITTEIDERGFDIGDPLIDPILTSTPILDLRSGLFVLMREITPDRLIGLARGMISTLEGEELDGYVEFVTTHPDHRQRELDTILTLLPASSRIDGTLNDQQWFRRLPLTDYETILCPVLVVHGTYDAAVPIAHAEFVAGQLEHAELHRFASDHFLMTGPDADQFTRTVRTFIDQTVPSTGETT